jgi:hypothetical protein
MYHQIHHQLPGRLGVIKGSLQECQGYQLPLEYLHELTSIHDTPRQTGTLVDHHHLYLSDVIEGEQSPHTRRLKALALSPTFRKCSSIVQSFTRI